MNSFDFQYFFTAPGQLNIGEIICLLGASISLGLTSPFFAELVDRIGSIYVHLNTFAVRCVFQVFCVVSLTIGIILLLVHLSGIRHEPRKFRIFNRTCLIVATVLGLMMISIGICAAFWEDKLRRTPASIRRGYFLDENQVLFGQSTHPRPGAAAAAATFSIIAGILFLIEASIRPTLETGVQRVPVEEKFNERIIPIEKLGNSRQQIV